MARNLKGMVSVITGASSGIGKALAINLASRGGKLVLGARRLDLLQDLTREIGGENRALQVDVSCPDACNRLISSAVDSFGRLDTVVCNAGFGFARSFDAMSLEDIRHIFQ